jgi:hypothetical protein
MDRLNEIIDFMDKGTQFTTPDGIELVGWLKELREYKKKDISNICNIPNTCRLCNEPIGLRTMANKGCCDKCYTIIENAEYEQLFNKYIRGE